MEDKENKQIRFFFIFYWNWMDWFDYVGASWARSGTPEHLHWHIAHPNSTNLSTHRNKVMETNKTNDCPLDSGVSRESISCDDDFFLSYLALPNYCELSLRYGRVSV